MSLSLNTDRHTCLKCEINFVFLQGFHQCLLYNLRPFIPWRTLIRRAEPLEELGAQTAAARDRDAASLTHVQPIGASVQLLRDKPRGTRATLTPGPLCSRPRSSASRLNRDGFHSGVLTHLPRNIRIPLRRDHSVQGPGPRTAKGKDDASSSACLADINRRSRLLAEGRDLVIALPGHRDRFCRVSVSGGSRPFARSTRFCQTNSFVSEETS